MNFRRKTILITGATGLIGSNLVSKFLDMKNVNVIAMGRDRKKLFEYFSEHLDDKNFKFITHDISLPLNEIEDKIDYIFHAAGSHESKIITESPMEIIKPNLIGTINCLNYLQEQKKKHSIVGRFILLSSVTIYRNNSDTNLIVTEKDTSCSDFLESKKAPYSESKRMSEIIALSYSRQFGVDLVICRLSTVYGATKNTTESAFFDFMKNAILRKNIHIKDSSLARRDNIYIDDAILGLLTVAMKGKSANTYNISSNNQLNNFLAIDEIAKIIIDISNTKFSSTSKNIKLIFDDCKNYKRKPGIILDNSKLKKIGWNLSTDFKIGISKIIDLYNKKNIIEI